MRPEKASIVSDLSEKLNRSPFLLVTDYQRMKVDQFGELRNRLAPAGAEVRVVKNSFLKRAMADSGMPDVGDKLTGQTAIVMGENDVAPVAKILKLFAAESNRDAKIGVLIRRFCRHRMWKRWPSCFARDFASQLLVAAHAGDRWSRFERAGVRVRRCWPQKLRRRLRSSTAPQRGGAITPLTRPRRKSRRTPAASGRRRLREQARRTTKQRRILRI